MPFINVKLYEDRLDERTEAALIARLTEAVGDVFGPGAAEQTWIAVQGVPRRRWGIGGKPGSTDQ
ncbi:hypothetical protein SY2F82_07570 [Streptomyces sp. Y2F8-2]|uniref:tautomerase family protein n=1 Tax=Streptomyces sp. Y2F8-2 TaxID=2759675 RepID=UPI0019063EB0|nr:tautomerase family protein [Streptomyces sp. Y2F8-2]GHJ98959.1 hypothetical protein SY2F82_07570 [Streptomyces sp. Y2F8-2]